MRVRPLLALTLGDVAGVGPEVLVRALSSMSLLHWQPLIVGDLEVVQRAAALIQSPLQFGAVSGPHAAGPESAAIIPVWNPSGLIFADDRIEVNDPRCGAAAYEWLIAATEAALRGEVDGLVTAPLSKAALHRAGHFYPGHTEILAERCGVADYAMVLHLPQGGRVTGNFGITVAHTTLHTSIASVPGLLNPERVLATIRLVHDFVQQLGCGGPRVGVCALNPHAGEGGLFGDEEARIIAPAVQQANEQGLNASGPIPADTLLLRAVNGEFDAVVAMYHDQGHIALKLIGFRTAVNVTLGLPIIRTSPSHGTAFDIAWQGRAEGDGMQAAIATALQMISRRTA